ncbi:hypothetical protein BKA63DRAFT_179546 [Paraphoma chrysanthemicola]|nr:hypothetical protein BKA63DRAFT_179546 [Paraphoma chrysanthemicola]
MTTCSVLPARNPKCMAMAAPIELEKSSAPLTPPFSEQCALSKKATQAGSVFSPGTVAPTDPNILLEALDPYESLPTTSSPLIISDNLAITEDTLPSFLRRDLDLSRLNCIHNHLWIAGRPMLARPLHRYRLVDYQFLGVEQMDLHLLSVRSSPNQLLLKPLPEWILSHKFWTKHLCSLRNQIYTLLLADSSSATSG